MRETGGDAPATYLYTYDALGNLIASEKKDGSGATVLRAYQEYDASGQLVGQSWYTGRDGYSESYTYNTTDGSFATVTTATGETVELGYDELQRLTSAETGLYTRSYSYRDLSDTKTTEQVAQVQYNGLPTALSFGYTYDARGNIASYTAPGRGTVTYTYDVQDQLLSAVGDQSYTYTYDGCGNILTANGHSYTYGNTQWRDLLTAYDGEAITYDQIGNPLSYYNGNRWTFTWENGRSLAMATDGTTSVSYAYDAGGLRTAKTVGDVTHSYLYASGQLLRETYGDDTLDFFYDSNGHPYALKHNGTVYYYITNLQGDVMYLLDAQGNTAASYEYDPYGDTISATGTMAQINPLRYRGYYYDAELRMYYLQSRYYDPVVGRFINADSYVSTGQGIIGCNMFAYCHNSPIDMVDSDGKAAVSITIKVLSTLLAAVGCFSILSIIASPSFRSNWNKLCNSMYTTVRNSLDALRGMSLSAAIALSQKTKDISQSVLDSFAKVKTIPVYRSTYEKHHIVAKKAHNASYAKRVLSSVGIRINDGINLVFLKTGLHRRIHTNLYYGWANSVVISAYDAAKGNRNKQYVNVVGALGTLKAFLLSLNMVAPF